MKSFFLEFKQQTIKSMFEAITQSKHEIVTIFQELSVGKVLGLSLGFMALRSSVKLDSI